MTSVDLRPRWLMVVGVGLLLLALFLGAGGALSDMLVLLNQVKAKSLALHHQPLNVGRYLVECGNTPRCWMTYYHMWKAPAWTQAMYASWAITGATFWLFAQIWKPEMLFRRQVRVAAGRMELNRKASTAQPRGVLKVPEVSS